jgi:hypothetical protein
LPAYDVLPCSRADLVRICESISKTHADIIEKKCHTDYWEEYFSTLKAKTIVVEYEYVDRDYLEDYSAYYVRCFPAYSRFCTRLHFFTLQFDEAAFSAMLEDPPSAAAGLQDSYLGFIVLKPLPRTFVGRTCLKTYDPDGGRRHYPIVRKCEANLFGIPLSVDSLPFQEQDHAVAACATSALWSVFQGTGRAFQHRIPSPVEITRAATDQRPLERFTDEGLNAEQISRAIRDVGLEPAALGVTNPFDLTGTAYAYLKGGVPLILGVTLLDFNATPPTKDGDHAVAITGYSLGHTSPTVDPRTQLCLLSSRVDGLYAHDDQVGPFARMKIDATPTTVSLDDDEDDEEIAATLSTSWLDDNDARGKIRAAPVYIVAPLYHKIRIPFEVVHDEVAATNRLLAALCPHASLLQQLPPLVWDIYLTTGSDLKMQIVRDQLLTGPELKSFLTTPLPRFVWRAHLAGSPGALLDVIIDATDIHQGELVSKVLHYDQRPALGISTLFSVMDAAQLAEFRREPGWKILKRLTP